MSMTTSATKTISLLYDGYWRVPGVGGIPNEPGVYSVYACTHNAAAKTVSIRELLYIGESVTVRDRIRQHLSGTTGRSWNKHLLAGEQLCFAFAPISGTTRERAEAALIHQHKPPENTEYVRSFPAIWSPTTVKTSGQNAELSPHFTVRSS